MSNTVTINCTVDTTNPEATLGFEAWCNDQKFFDTNHVQAQQQVVIEIADDVSEHELRFILKNKTSNHTQVDASGNIVSDARLIVTDLTFDEIKTLDVPSKKLLNALSRSDLSILLCIRHTGNPSSHIASYKS
jgi:hypothetical protein